MNVLNDPVVLPGAELSPPVKAPIPVLPSPVVRKRALLPIAVLYWLLLFDSRATKPKAVFPMPVVLDESASSPVAVLPLPDVLNRSAFLPVATLPLPLIVKLPAPLPMKMLLAPKLWANGKPPNAITPTDALAVAG